MNDANPTHRPSRARSTRPRQGVAATAAEHEGLNVSSLIDVAFLLLIFFLVTSTLRATEADLTTRLPTGEEGAAEPTLAVVVSVRADGAVLWGDELASGPDDRHMGGFRGRLSDHIEVAAAMQQRPVFVLDVDEEALHQRLVDVLNAFAHEQVTDLVMRQD